MDSFNWANEIVRRDRQPDPTLVAVVMREKLAQESRGLIDEKIANFDECIRRLKSQRNELAPISRLPPEVMSIIFSYAAGGSQDPRPLYRYFFTHVSQTWRSAALNSPTLWRVLPSSIPWANVMLERSKAAGLVIRLRLSYWTPASPRLLFWKDVFCNHASRIRELDLSETSKSTLDVLFGDLQPSSLLLHSLQLHQSTQHSPLTFPTAVMQTEHLQSLSVTGYDGAWYSLPLRCLINLKMHNIPNRPLLSDFIETLRGNPQLQTLDMEDSLPLTSGSMKSIASIDLPRLGSLRLSSTRNPKEVSNILCRITAPTTATLEINCRNRDSAQDDRDTFTDLASSLSVFFSATSRRAAVSYDDALIRAQDFSLHLSAWNIGNPDVRPRKRNLQLTIQPKTQMSPQTMLQELFPSLPLLNIKSLTLDLDSAHMLLGEVLCNLSCLQNVTVIGNCTFDFIRTLMHKPQDYYDQDSAFYSVSFPALQTLCIVGTAFRPEWECPIEDLRECLMERYERKAELTKLKIAACYDIDACDVELFKEIVVDVEWDGLVMEEERSEPGDDYLQFEGYVDDYDMDDSDFDPFSFF